MQKELQIIKKVCSNYFSDCEIILFGSRAKGNFEQGSDYDFLIILKSELSTDEKRMYQAKIRKALAQKKIPADVLIQSKKEISTKIKITGHIVKTAVEEGRLL